MAEPLKVTGNLGLSYNRYSTFNEAWEECALNSACGYIVVRNRTLIEKGNNYRDDKLIGWAHEFELSHASNTELTESYSKGD